MTHGLPVTLRVRESKIGSLFFPSLLGAAIMLPIAIRPRKWRLHVKLGSSIIYVMETAPSMLQKGRRCSAYNNCRGTFIPLLYWVDMFLMQ